MYVIKLTAKENQFKRDQVIRKEKNSLVDMCFGVKTKRIKTMGQCDGVGCGREYKNKKCLISESDVLKYVN